MVLEARSVSTNLVKKDGFRRLEYCADETMRNFGCQKIETLGASECGYVHHGAKSVGTDMKFDNLRKNKRDKGSKAEKTQILRSNGLDCDQNA